MPAILLAHVVFNLAVVVRTVGAVWDHLPPDLEAAAATLGASPWRAFARGHAAAAAPGRSLAAASIVFVFTFTSFGVIRVLGDAGTSTIEVEIWRQATQLGDIGAAATLPCSSSSRSAPASPGRRGSSAATAGRSPCARWPAADARRRRQRLLVGGVAGRHRRRSSPPPLRRARRALAPQLGDGHSLTAWRTLGRPEVRPGRHARRRPARRGRDVAAHGRRGHAARRHDRDRRRLAITAARRRGRLLDTGLMLPIATSAVTIGFGMLITFDVPPVDWRARGGSCRSARRSSPCRSSCAPCCRCCAASTPACTRRRRRSARSPIAGLARGHAAPPAPPGRRPPPGSPRRSRSASSAPPASCRAAARPTMPIAIDELLGRAGRAAPGAGLRAGHDPRRDDGRRRASPSTSPATGDHDVPCSTSATSPSASAGHRCSTGVVAARRRRRGRRPARAVGQRQEHAAAGRSPASSCPTPGTVLLDGARHHRTSDPPAGHRDGVPGRAAVPPPRRRRQRRVRAADAGVDCPRPTIDRRVDEMLALVGLDRVRPPRRHRPERRRGQARRPRPVAGAGPARAAARRAADRPRPRAPRPARRRRRPRSCGPPARRRCSSPTTAQEADDRRRPRRRGSTACGGPPHRRRGAARRRPPTTSAARVLRDGDADARRRVRRRRRARHRRTSGSATRRRS